MHKNYLYEAAEKFLNEELNKKNILYSQEALNKRQQAGLKILIASASIDPIVYAVSKKFSVDFICSTLEYKNGYCTGQLSKDLLGKKSNYISTDIEEIFTDNKSDIDVILISKKAFIISDKKNMPYWQEKIRPQDEVFII